MLAAALGGSVLLVAVATVGLGSNAQAATTVNQTGIKLFAQINNNGLSGVQNLQPTGTPNNTAGHSFAIVVSPSTSVSAGEAISISISSSTLNICNGPASAAAANGEELDAVIVIDGTQYLLRGPQNTIAVNASTFNNANHAECKNSLFQPGWVISSAAGGSSGNSVNTTAPTGTAAATTGLGTASPAAPATPVALVAPASGGSYDVAFKGLVLNSLSGTSTAALGDPFDQNINLDNGGHSAADPNGGPSFCDNSAACAQYAGPGGTALSVAGIGSFESNDPTMYISNASPTTVVPTTGNPPGTLASTVNNPTARDLAIPASTAWAPVTLTVTEETGTPTDTGTATDTGTPTDTGTATDTGTPTDTGTATGEPTATVTETVTETATATSTATVTETATETATATVTATETVPGPTVTATETVPGPTVTATETVPGATVTATETVPGPTVTATETAAGPTVTATETVPGPTVTQTVTETAGTPTPPGPNCDRGKKTGNPHCDNSANAKDWWMWGGGWWGGWGDGGGQGGHGGHGGFSPAAATTSTAGTASLAALGLIALALFGSQLYVRKVRPTGRHR